MRHQGHVIVVVAANVLESVGETLAACEMLLEGRETAGQRMPARIDDAGIGQHQMDQAEMQEVVRHLVDEQRCGSLALDTRVLEIAFAEFAQGIGVEAEHHVVVWHRLAGVALAAQVTRDRGDLGQLHRAFDGRMAGQDLLDQGRAGARQADDEDRIPGR